MSLRRTYNERSVRVHLKKIPHVLVVDHLVNHLVDHAVHSAPGQVPEPHPGHQAWSLDWDTDGLYWLNVGRVFHRSVGGWRSQ